MSMSKRFKHVRSEELRHSRAQLADHWNTIHDHGDPPTKALAVMALEHLGNAISYAIDGRVCSAVFTAKAPPCPPPTAYGLAIFDLTFRLDDLPVTGFHWGTNDDIIRIVPLTPARTLGLTPPKSPAPLGTGFVIPDPDNPDPDIHAIIRVVYATWSAITKTGKASIVGAGRGNGVIVTHSRR